MQIIPKIVPNLISYVKHISNQLKDVIKFSSSQKFYETYRL